MPSSAEELWYDTPASTWNEALPIGNGRLGCMIHGRTTTELLSLNEDSVWYGGQQERTPKVALKHLAQLRQLIRDEQHEKAESLVRKAFFATPWAQRHYEPLGSLLLDFEHDEENVSEYRSSLDLAHAVAKVQYVWKGVKVEREMIASCPDNVLALRIRASTPIQFSVRLTRKSEREFETIEFLDSISVREDQKVVMLVTPGGRDSIRACCALSARVDEEGTVETMNNTLFVTSKETVVLLSSRTTFRYTNFEAQAISDLDAAGLRTFDELLNRHNDDYIQLYSSTKLELGTPEHVDTLPTNQRISQPATPDLINLYANYARYLSIASSRRSKNPSLQPFDLPSNLQGIWNNSFTPGWGARPTININTEMNYWPCGPSNLSALETPLFALLERMAVRGRHTARVMYGCGGWCAHNQTDIWADTDIAERWMPSALWPFGGAWLCLHIWEHFLFTLDVELLKRLFPVTLGAAEFLLDFLVEHTLEDGTVWLLTNPSLSPENTFVDSKGNKGVFTQGSVMDIGITSALFNAVLNASNELRSLEPKAQVIVSRIQSALPLLPATTISPITGLLQEWGPLHDYADHELGHRHVSHLFGLHPGTSISPTTTPALAAAARAVLAKRLANGGGHTGWSRAWLINMFARLHDADAVRGHVEHLLAAVDKGGSTLPNLLDSHPPFQIDGNFGGAAGVMETIVQSQEVDDKGRRVLRLLPACPWEKGAVERLGCRGGWKISFRWEKGSVQRELKVEPVQVEKDTIEGSRNMVVVFPGGAEVELRGRMVHAVQQPQA